MTGIFLIKITPCRKITVYLNGEWHYDLSYLGSTNVVKTYANQTNTRT
jgi:hypothetical protein